MPDFWDHRLSVRNALAVPFRGELGQTYFRLVAGEWLDVDEAKGLHHILVEVLNEAGQRMIGVPVILENGGRAEQNTEEKRGESYAAAIPMVNLAPAYSIRVGDFSDKVSGLGLGTIEHPNNAFHTSYRFVFQRAIFGGGGANPGNPGNEDWARIRQLAGEMLQIADKHR